jgi:hypothetical protein
MLRAEDDTMREFAEDSKTGRAAKTLVKEGPLRITQEQDTDTAQDPQLNPRI